MVQFDDLPWFVMQYVHNAGLDVLTDRPGPLPTRFAGAHVERSHQAIGFVDDVKFQDSEEMKGY